MTFWLGDGTTLPLRAAWRAGRDPEFCVGLLSHASDGLPAGSVAVRRHGSGVVGMVMAGFRAVSSVGGMFGPSAPRRLREVELRLELPGLDVVLRRREVSTEGRPDEVGRMEVLVITTDGETVELSLTDVLPGPAGDGR